MSTARRRGALADRAAERQARPEEQEHVQEIKVEEQEPREVAVGEIEGPGEHHGGDADGQHDGLRLFGAAGDAVGRIGPQGGERHRPDEEGHDEHRPVQGRALGGEHLAKGGDHPRLARHDEGDERQQNVGHGGDEVADVICNTGLPRHGHGEDGTTGCVRAP